MCSFGTLLQLSSLNRSFVDIVEYSIFYFPDYSLRPALWLALLFDSQQFCVSSTMRKILAAKLNMTLKKHYFNFLQALTENSSFYCWLYWFYSRSFNKPCSYSSSLQHLGDLVTEKFADNQVAYVSIRWDIWFIICSK